MVVLLVWVKSVNDELAEEFGKKLRAYSSEMVKVGKLMSFFSNSFMSNDELIVNWCFKVF